MTRSFTLIELLIVIAVVAILSVVVILALNPAELLKQARDSARLSDINTINKALALYQVDNPQGAFGTASTTYISYPDSSSSCANIGVSTSAIASGYALACSASLSYQKIDGTGWIPVNLSAITGGAPISQLPKDPINTTSSNNYYIYHGNSSNWAITALLESQKYLAQSAEKDGGYDPGRFEKGSSLALISQGEGLVGWWDFEEGLGSTTSTDKSGNSNNGTWNGTGTHYADGKVGMYAGQFNGNVAGDYVNAGNRSSLDILGSITVGVWIKTSGDGRILSKGWRSASWSGYTLTGRYTGKLALHVNGCSDGGIECKSTKTINDNSWHFAVGTVQGTTLKVYVDGDLNGTYTVTGVNSFASDPLVLATRYSDFSEYFTGQMDDVRVYNRALAAAEIAAIYNSQR